MDKDNNEPVKTVPMLREELQIVRAFMKTSVYRDYVSEMRSDRDNYKDEVFGAAPNSISDFVSREQAMGAGRVAEKSLTWFVDQEAMLDSFIREREAPDDPA